jgi:hypothetical protein
MIKLRRATPKGAMRRAIQKPVAPPPNAFDTLKAMKAPIM